MDILPLAGPEMPGISHREVQDKHTNGMIPVDHRKHSRSSDLFFGVPFGVQVVLLRHRKGIGHRLGFEETPDERIFPVLDGNAGPSSFEFTFGGVKTDQRAFSHVLQVHSGIFQLRNTEDFLHHIMEDIEEVLLMEGKNPFKIGHD